MIIASDLHIGDGSRTDPWRSLELQERWIVQCCEVADYGKAVLAGDVAEGWNYRWRDIYRGRPWDALCLGIRIMQRAGLAVYYLPGNHDAGIDPAQLPEGVIVADRVVIDGVLVLHGHQGDRVNSDHAWVGRGLSLAAHGVALVSRRANAWLRSAAQRLEGVGRYSRLDRHADWAEGLIGGEVERVITGHTHRRRERGVYRDAGVWERDGWLIV